jgi:serine/threonine protein kinase
MMDNQLSLEEVPMNGFDYAVEKDHTPRKKTASVPVTPYSSNLMGGSSKNTTPDKTGGANGSSNNLAAMVGVNAPGSARILENIAGVPTKGETVAAMRANQNVHEIKRSELRLGSVDEIDGHKTVYRGWYKAGGFSAEEKDRAGIVVAVHMMTCDVFSHQSRENMVQLAVQNCPQDADFAATVSGHHNILTFYGCCYDDFGDAPPSQTNTTRINCGIAYVMELCAHGSLFTALHRGDERLMSSKLKKNIVHGIISGLEQIHTYRLIHRELRTHSVMLAEGYVPKLCDFGAHKRRMFDDKPVITRFDDKPIITRFDDKAVSGAASTGEGGMGSLAPEQFPPGSLLVLKGSAAERATQLKVTDKSDIWAFGSSHMTSLPPLPILPCFALRCLVLPCPTAPYNTQHPYFSSFLALL